MSSTEPPVEQHDQDTKDLMAFGYQQELKRELNTFSSFAVAFSYISPSTGIFTLFFLGMSALGAHLWWTWPVVAAFQLIVKDLTKRQREIYQFIFAPGFSTAVMVTAQGVERIRTTAESHRRIAIIEVMGRHSGYIALGSAYEAIYRLPPDATGVRPKGIYKFFACLDDIDIPDFDS